MKRNYNAIQLLDMCRDWLNLENEYHVFVREHCNFLQEELPEYYRLSSAVETAWRMFCTACAMVDTDSEKVVATAKAINRYKNNHNESSIYINWSVQRKLIRFWEKLD